MPTRNLQLETKEFQATLCQFKEYNEVGTCHKKWVWEKTPVVEVNIETGPERLARVIRQGKRTRRVG